MMLGRKGDENEPLKKQFQNLTKQTNPVGMFPYKVIVIMIFVLALVIAMAINLDQTIKKAHKKAQDQPVTAPQKVWADEMAIEALTKFADGPIEGPALLDSEHFNVLLEKVHKGLNDNEVHSYVTAGLTAKQLIAEPAKFRKVPTFVRARGEVASADTLKLQVSSPSGLEYVTVLMLRDSDTKFSIAVILTEPLADKIQFTQYKGSEVAKGGQFYQFEGLFLFKGEYKTVKYVRKEEEYVQREAAVLLARSMKRIEKPQLAMDIRPAMYTIAGIVIGGFVLAIGLTILYMRLKRKTAESLPNPLRKSSTPPESQKDDNKGA